MVKLEMLHYIFDTIGKGRKEVNVECARRVTQQELRTATNDYCVALRRQFQYHLLRQVQIGELFGLGRCYIWPKKGTVVQRKWVAGLYSLKYMSNRSRCLFDLTSYL